MAGNTLLLARLSRGEEYRLEIECNLDIPIMARTERVVELHPCHIVDRVNPLRLSHGIISTRGAPTRRFGGLVVEMQHRRSLFVAQSRNSRFSDNDCQRRIDGREDHRSSRESLLLRFHHVVAAGIRHDGGRRRLHVVRHREATHIHHPCHIEGCADHPAG